MDDFRNRSAKSMLTLPLVAVIAGVVWALPDPRSAWLWGGFAIVCALTYTLRELNNRFQLLRIRSRLVSATFLALFAALPDLHPAGTNLIPAIGLLPALFCLFGSYQQYRPEHYTFHAFFFLSIGSLVFPPLLVLSVFFYVTMALVLHTLTWRSLFAGLFGLVVPYWFYAGYLVWMNRLEELEQQFTPFLQYSWPDFQHLPLPHVASFCFLSLLALLSTLHFVRTSFNDKIRTRVFLYVLIILELAIAGGGVLLPHHYCIIMPLYLVVASPLIAHYFALARGGLLMNVWFICWLLGLIALGIYNYGLPAIFGWA